MTITVISKFVPHLHGLTGSVSTNCEIYYADTPKEAAEKILRIIVENEKSEEPVISFSVGRE